MSSRPADSDTSPGDPPSLQDGKEEERVSREDDRPLNESFATEKLAVCSY